MDNPAAWHPDPTGRHEHRWWDGERWTEHVADAGQASVDPLEGDASATGSGGTDTAAAAGAGSSARPDETTPSPGSEQGAGTEHTGSGWQQPGGAGGNTEQLGGWGQGEQPHTGQQQGWQQPGAGGQTGGWGQPPGGQTGGWDQQQGGAQQWQQPQQQWPQATPAAEAPPSGSSGLAIFALIMGILSLVFFWVPVLGGLGALVAVIFGFVGRSSAKKRGVGGAGMGLAGAIVGIVALLLNILVSLAVFGAIRGFDFMGLMSEYEECMQEYNDEEFCDRQLEDDLMDRFGG